MKSQMLDEFESRIGVSLPAALKNFLLNPRELEEHDVLTVEEFTSLEAHSPDLNLPLRTLPFLVESCAYKVAIHFPRQSPNPLIVNYFHDVPGLHPITQDIDEFFLRIDGDFHKIYCDEAKTRLSPRPWVSLEYSDSSPPPELELLKPIALNTTPDGSIDLKLIGSIQRPIRRSKRLKSVKTGNRPSDIIARYFDAPLQLLDRDWWLNLSDAFIENGHFQEAIYALENCHAVHAISPHYGQTVFTRCLPTHTQYLKVFRKLEPLVNEHSDGLDCLIIARKIEVARETMVYAELERIEINLNREDSESEVFHEDADDEAEDEVDNDDNDDWDAFEQAIAQALQWQQDKRIGKEPVSNECPQDEFAVNVEVPLSALVAISREDAAAKIVGYSDCGEPVSHLPIESTSSDFRIDVGQGVWLQFDIRTSEISVGEVLYDIATYLHEVWVPNPARFRTGGLKLTDISARRLYWEGARNPDAYWLVVVDCSKQ